MDRHIQTFPLGGHFVNSVTPSVCIRQVKDSDLPDLQIWLNGATYLDPYKLSAGYYSMTGRNGLWILDSDDTQAIFCLHPNKTGTALVFPPIKGNIDDAVKLISLSLRSLNVDIQIARSEEPISGKTLKPMTEDTLDWVYPVHTLSTATVAQHAGKGFQHFRQKLNALNESKIEVRDLNPVQDKKAIEQILSEWGGNSDDVKTPYMRLLTCFVSLPMQGRITFFDGNPAGFSIWEETNPQEKTANAYAHIGLQNIKGMSQFVMLDMCQTLVSRGFDKVCIGGSETEGLDRFKRNLCPIQSISLFSGTFIPFQQPQYAMRKEVA